MDRIEIKTPGILIDELVTVMIKLSVFSRSIKTDEDRNRDRALKEKRQNLLDAIDRQIGLIDIANTINRLIDADIQCFFAQEKLFECDKNDDKIGAGEAAIKVQRLNARRNKALREVDGILGFGNITLTGKTYGEE